MATISLCMIVKNEEEVLARCLRSVKDLVDEIIIVDTGSVDKTKEIALQFTDKVFDFEWVDNFALARNYSFSKAKMDYVMWLDADDVIYEKDLEELIRLKADIHKYNTVMVKYNIAFDQHGNPTFSFYRERIVKNGMGIRWVGAVHEVMAGVMPILRTEAAVTHKKMRAGDSDRNLRIFEKQISEGEALDARQMYYYARELYYHKRYEEAISVFDDFFMRDNAWIENRIDACKLVSYCHNGLGNAEKGLFSLFKSFLYDVPRAEICCEIGQYFFAKIHYRGAIFWYEQALSAPKDSGAGGFVSEDCYGYIPYMQLCVLYDRIGDRARAIKYNDLAAAIKPMDQSVLYNKAYFSGKEK